MKQELMGLSKIIQDAAMEAQVK